MTRSRLNVQVAAWQEPRGEDDTEESAMGLPCMFDDGQGHVRWG